MKASLPRIAALALLAVAGWLLIAGAASPPKRALLEPDKLVILSTTDVRGKISPCG